MTSINRNSNLNNAIPSKCCGPTQQSNSSNTASAVPKESFTSTGQNSNSGIMDMSELRNLYGNNPGLNSLVERSDNPIGDTADFAGHAAADCCG